MTAMTTHSVTTAEGADALPREATARPVAPSRGRLQPLGLAAVTITGGPWGERQRINAAATIPHIEHWLEREGWLGNFDAAAQGRLPDDRRGREFSDSEVYKLLEAMAWELGRRADAALAERYDAIVRRVAAAQEPDGYLSTNFGRPGQQPRYSDLEWGHELYCYGHLIQAAVARARTHGDDLIVQVAHRVADHVCDVFGPGGIESVCGHPVIEPALVELYRVTGDGRYLEQARLFVERRGHQVLDDIEYGRTYFQDDVPVREATTLRGHAVRAVYLAAGAVDLAMETDDAELLAAVSGQLRHALARRTYITGGMGSRHQDEGFGEDWELPPDRAYCETCAGIASIMVSWRLYLATGDVRYPDLIERTLFNVVATSPRDDGRAFFYANPLQQRVAGNELPPDQVNPRAEGGVRAPWFEVSCCPTNVARTLATWQAYAASVDGDVVSLLQYAPATLEVALADGETLGLAVRTDYPRGGVVDVEVTHAPTRAASLRLRVPAWADGATLGRAGGPAAAVSPGWAMVPGLVVGDTLRLTLPVAPRLSWPDPRIDALRGTVAVERGPIVLCLESRALADPVDLSEVGLVIDQPVEDDDDGALVTIGPLPSPGVDAACSTARLVPYHRWAQEGPTAMRVFLPVV